MGQNLIDNLQNPFPGAPQQVQQTYHFRLGNLAKEPPRLYATLISSTRDGTSYRRSNYSQKQVLRGGDSYVATYTSEQKGLRAVVRTKLGRMLTTMMAYLEGKHDGII